VAQKTAATGFQSHGDTRLYLTLPPDEKILSASVLWPGGNLEQLELDSNRLRPGQSLVVRQGSGIISSSPLRNRAR
jgi:hypothetical protein